MVVSKDRKDVVGSVAKRDGRGQRNVRGAQLPTNQPDPVFIKDGGYFRFSKLKKLKRAF